MNPLMMQIGQTASPFSGKITGALQAAGMMNLAIQAYQAYRSGHLDEFAQDLYQKNPDFRKFADANRGKTLGQMAKENGVDLDQLSGMLK